MNNPSMYVAMSSVLVAIISAAVMLRGQRNQAQNESKVHSNAQVQTIFDGYGKIVEELRIEVERLMATIAILQEEQVACDERNNALIQEVEELKHRLVQLESRTDG
jgi:hypothetical protein